MLILKNTKFYYNNKLDHQTRALINFSGDDFNTTDDVLNDTHEVLLRLYHGEEMIEDEIEEIEDDRDDEIDEDDDPPEDGEMDVEVDEDPDEQPPDDQEEAYISD